MRQFGVAGRASQPPVREIWISRHRKAPRSAAIAALQYAKCLTPNPRPGSIKIRFRSLACARQSSIEMVRLRNRRAARPRSIRHSHRNAPSLDTQPQWIRQCPACRDKTLPKGEGTTTVACIAVGLFDGRVMGERQRSAWLLPRHWRSSGVGAGRRIVTIGLHRLDHEIDALLGDARD